jgi:hypothetical protein
MHNSSQNYYANSSAYYAEKSFITLTPVANVIQLFQRNYTTICTTPVKIIMKFADSSVNCYEKSL